MFRARTLLVLGAGASAEVGLPVGDKLLSEIASLTNFGYEAGRFKRGDYHLSEALKLTVGGDIPIYNEHLHAAWQLAASAEQALSIDNVIDALEDEKVERVGKLGIVRAIHLAERASQYFKDEHDRYEGLEVRKFKGTWYDSLTKLLCEGVKKSGVGSIFDNLQIINFNYDRCLEHYLPFSIANYYGLQPQDIRALIPKLVMLRPYGIAGKLPGQEGALSVPFGGGEIAETAAAATQIRTFTERLEEGEELARIKSAAEQAERIVFLGFAFHRQNLELIAARAPANVEVLATVFEVSKSDQSVIEDELETAFEIQDAHLKRNIELTDATCARLFRDYWRTLTADPRPQWDG